MAIVSNVKPAISLIFTAATRVYTSPPVQGMLAYVRVGAPAVSSYASEAK